MSLGYRNNYEVTSATQSNRTFTFSAEDYGAVFDTTRDPNMATLEAAKLNFIHKKILERYLENPNSDDEQILKLMDLHNTRPAATHQAMGQSEHPLYSRDRWLSEAAAKLTDEGYWTWVSKQINSTPIYRFNGETIFEIAPPVTPDWGNESMPVAGPPTVAELLRATAPAPPPMPWNQPPAREAQVFYGTTDDETFGTIAPTTVSL